jgi:hypothetical protein
MIVAVSWPDQFASQILFLSSCRRTAIEDVQAMNTAPSLEIVEWLTA